MFLHQWTCLLCLLPLTAIGSAVTAVVGSSFGAKNKEYISRAHIYGAKFGVIFGTIVTAILVIFSTPLSTIFAYTNNTASLIPGISTFLKIACLSLPFTGAGMVSSFFYQGIGKGTTSLMWTIIREVIFTVSFTYFFGIYINWGLIGIWLGLAIGRTLASILNK